MKECPVLKTSDVDRVKQGWSVLDPHKDVDDGDVDGTFMQR